MNSRVKDVKPLPNYHLELIFTNRERKLFDVRPYLSAAIFSVSHDPALLDQVKAVNGTVAWPDDLDLDPDTLYLDSKPLHRRSE